MGSSLHSGEGNKSRKKRIKIIVGTTVAVVIIAAIVIPIVIVYSAEAVEDLGDRIACDPLSTSQFNFFLNSDENYKHYFNRYGNRQFNMFR